MVTALFPFVMAILSMAEPGVQSLQAFDRSSQIQAVAAIATDIEPHREEIVQLWRTTDRWDVRMAIIDVLAATGQDESHLLPVLREALPGQSGNDLRLNVALHAAFGSVGVDNLVEHIEQGETRLTHLLYRVLKHTGTDARPAFDRLLASPSSAVRLAAVNHLTMLLEYETRLRVLSVLTRDEDAAVRRAAAERLNPPRADELKTIDPDLHAEYLSTLMEMLDSPDGHLVAVAASRLSVQPPRDESLALKLRSIWERDDVNDRTRSSAMRGFLARNPDEHEAVRVVVSAIGKHPRPACSALGYADADLIDTDDMIRIVIDAIGPTYNQYEGLSTAANLIYPVMGRSDQRKRIGVRALPVLLDMLDEEHQPDRNLAAGVLAALGPAASDAIPSLLRHLAASEQSREAGVYARALIAIAPNDPRVVRAVSGLVQAAIESGDDPHFVAYNTLEQLRRSIPDEDWVQRLAETVIRLPDHRWREASLGPFPPRVFGPIIARHADLFISELLDNSAVLEMLALEESAGIELLQRLNSERDRRSRAAGALQTIDDPSGEVVTALLAVISNRAADFDEGGEYASGFSHEKYAVRDAVRALADIMGRRPRHFERVVLELRDDPTALLRVLEAPIYKHPSQPSHLQPPHDLSNEAKRIVCELLKASTSSPTVRELGYCDHDELRAVVLHAIRFGSRNQPSVSMGILGELRPITDESLDLVRSHLNDTRGGMRAAAINAAGHMGPEAHGMIDQLIASDDPDRHYFMSHYLQSALPRIAPEDEWVVRYLAGVSERRNR